jgi:hypothetical protein
MMRIFKDQTKNFYRFEVGSTKTSPPVAKGQIRICVANPKSNRWLEDQDPEKSLENYDVSTRSHREMYRHTSQNGDRVRGP